MIEKNKKKDLTQREKMLRERDKKKESFELKIKVV